MMLVVATVIGAEADRLHHEKYEDKCFTSVVVDAWLTQSLYGQVLTESGHQFRSYRPTWKIGHPATVCERWNKETGKIEKWWGHVK